MNGHSKRHESDYVNVEYGLRNGERYLASIGETALRSRSGFDRSTNCITSTSDSIDGVSKTDCMSKQQRPTLFGKKTRKMKCHANRADSDSSTASGIGDSQDDKTRELEHYNKLKLNLNQLQQNKKALKGVKLLYSADPGHSREAVPNGHRVFRDTKERGATNSTHTSTPARRRSNASKYTKEGHGNQLYSVTGKPVNRSSSLLWSVNPIRKSHSTGDMNNITEEDQGHQIHSLQNRQSAQRSHSFSEVESTKVFTRETKQHHATTQQRPKPDRNRRRELAATNGEHHTVLSPVAARNRPQQTAEEPSKYKRRSLNSEHTSKRHSIILSYSSEAKYEEEFPQSNKLLDTPHQMSTAYTSVHNGTCPMTCSCSGINFTDSIATITVDSNGVEYTSPMHDISIVVPRGATKKQSIELDIGVITHSPFEFPDNRRPVSPILWVGATSDFKLKKPIELTLPHFIHLTQGCDERKNQGLVFMRASDKCRSGSNRRYQFHKVSESGRWISRSHATLSTKQLGFFCIVGNISKLKPQYCILPIIPRTISQPMWKFHYCVTYLLKTCITVVKNQFGEDWEILPPRKFEFDSLVEGRRQERIEIQGSEVDWWRNEDRMLESISMYPPRFTIRVHGQEARESSVALIEFTGVTEELTTEVVLPLRSVEKHRASIDASTPTSSVFSPNQVSSSSSYSSSLTPSGSAEDFGYSDSADYDHLPTLEELNQTHTNLTYHNGHIDISTDEDLQVVATAVTETLQGEWSILQVPLQIPDHIMLDVLHQRTIKQQVLRLLKEWRNHSTDSSKEALAHCLQSADKRLRSVTLFS